VIYRLLCLYSSIYVSELWKKIKLLPLKIDIAKKILNILDFVKRRDCRRSFGWCMNYDNGDHHLK